MITDKFGYLPEPLEIDFSFGKIYPIANYDEIKQDVLSSAYNKKFIFPPNIVKTKIPESLRLSKIDKNTDMSSWEEIPNTERPSLMMHLPATHIIELNLKDKYEMRDKYGSFFINLCGFIYGTRVQFYNWKIDNKARVSNRSGFHAPNNSIINLFENASKTIKTFDDEYLKRITNILFIYLRSLSEEYEWLEFSLLYMVFDSCYKLAYDYYDLEKKRIPHANRLKVLAEKFKIIVDEDEFDTFVTYRNNLFHEALWRDESPGKTNISSFYIHILFFQSFVSKIIAALTGYDGPYISNVWKTTGRVIF
ncbi:hypothetical protein HNV12_22450 [Methanococcoides sp. SA1]|nr:hypothetical protein [Methanococcoides sp. SA1]